MMNAGAQPRSVRVGEARVTLVPDGRFRLDGGAMFGVVPRVLWEQRTVPDEQGRIQLALNAMLVESGGVRMLIDPGLGTHHDARFAQRHAVEQPPTVLDSLRAAGVAPEAIDVVVLTHLHWDHMGASTFEGKPAFPSARYVVQRREWEAALAPHARSRASYRESDFAPLATSGRLELVEGDVEVAPGVRLLAVGGHSDGMQLVQVQSKGETFLHLADLVPTRHHVDEAWIMAYDLYPVDTLRQRQRLLPRAIDEGWLVGFFHDTDVPFARLRRGKDGRRVVVEPAGAWPPPGAA